MVDEVREQKAEDPFRPIVIAVGSNLEALYLRRLLGARMGGHVGVRIVTLIDLAEALAGRELRQTGREPLPRLAEWRAAARVADSIGQESVIAPVAGRPGLAKALAATFGELVDAGIDELPVWDERYGGRDGQDEERPEAAGRPPAGDRPGEGAATSVQAAKLRELSELYRRFRRLRDGEGGARRFGRAELLRAAAGAVHRFEERFQTDRLFVYGFYDLNESQRSLLAACIRHLDVVAFLPFEGAAARGYRFAAPTLTWYRELAVEVEPRAPADGRAAPPVEIVSASGEVEEAREAAREVLRLAESGVPLHEIAIVYRQPDPYGRLVREALAAADIPHFFPAGTSLAETRHGRALTALLRIGSRGGGNFRRPDVIEWAHYAPVNWGAWAGIADADSGADRPGLPSEVGEDAPETLESAAPDVAAWDAVSAEAGVGAGLRAWRVQIEQWRRRRRADDAEEARPADRRAARSRDGGEGRGGDEEAEALLRFVEWLAAGVEALPAEATWGAWADALSQLATGMLSPGRHADWLVETLLQLRELETVEPEPVPYETMRQATGELLGRATVPIGRFQRSGVTVADVMSVRGVRFRAVLLLGMVEKGFPVPARQDPILLDEERLRLGTLPLKRRRSEEEALLFTLATQSASGYLKLFYPRMEAHSGRVRTPSHFLLEMAGRRIGYDELERLPFHRRVPNSRLYPGDPATALDLSEYDFAGLARAGKGADDNSAREVVAGLERLTPSFQRAREAVRARWGERALTRYDGIVPRAELPGADGSRERGAGGAGAGGASGAAAAGERSTSSIGGPFSASRLETYARCPHRYFFTYELALKVRQKPEEVKRIEPRDRGALVHEVLERFFARAGAEGLTPLRPEHRERARSLLKQQFDRTCGRMESERVVGYPLLWELEREQLWDDLTALLDDHLEERADWVPSRMELAFGAEGDVEIALGGGRAVRFQGKIDRLDRSADGKRARVIDYKTGGLGNRHDAPRPDGLTGGMHLQLPIYLLAARARFPDLSLSDLEAWYVYLTKAARRKRIPFQGTAWPEKEAEFRALVGSIVEGIESGRFFPYPQLGGDELGNCRSCDFQRICGPSIAARAARKAGAPERATFESMREVE